MTVCTTPRRIIWSYGGGTQSIAIACLIARGALPKPECVVIADTGREATETWEYLNNHVRPLLEGVGCHVEIAPHSLAKVDLYSHKGELLIPAWTKSGALDTYCSGEWKRDVVSRYLRAKGYGPANPVQTWIGISLDEIERAKPSRTEWQEYVYPLIDLLPHPVRRGGCLEIIKASGLPLLENGEGPKSSCWMCPFRSNPQWLRLKEKYPADFAAACELDDAMRARDAEHAVFIHKARVPLREAVLREQQQPSLFDGCDSGFCWT